MFTENRIGIDVTLGGLSDINEALARSSYENYFDNIKLRICSPEDLLISKTVAGRPRGWIDIESVNIRQSSLDWDDTFAGLQALTAYEDLSHGISRLNQLKGEFYKR